MGEKRIAWGITGAGNALEECIETLLKCERVDVFLTKAAEEVLRMYGLDERLNAPKIRMYRESRASAPQVGRFFGGMYSVFVVAPATSNSVAKFVRGISDSFVTNLFAQAGKSRVPIIVYPSDLIPETDSFIPSGKSIKVYPRPIDLENTKRLRSFEGVTVVDNQKELAQQVSQK
jgi:flavoprotein